LDDSMVAQKVASMADSMVVQKVASMAVLKVY
jgi:hypothetical protein